MEKKKSKKILKGILIVIAVLIVFLLIHTTRNFIIILNLQDKISEYTDSNNYHIKSVANEKNGVVMTVDYYKKDDKQVIFLERDNNGEITKMSIYDTGERKDMFIDTPGSKIAQLDVKTSLVSMQIYNHLQTESKWQTFLFSMMAKVRSEELNGKDCYRIDNFISSNVLSNDEGNRVFIDKETGLVVKNYTNGTITEREHEFDNVDDWIFVEPDIGEYTLKKD